MSESYTWDYKEAVASKLNSIQVPSCIYCEDLHCQHHSVMIEDYTLSVLEAIEESAKETLPSIGGGGGNRKYKTVAGWNEHVKPFYQESKFWHSVWASAGKPFAGGLQKPNIDTHLGGSAEPGTNYRMIILLMNFLKET